jgi:hypothetical protein
MPENRSILLCTSGVLLAGFAAHLLAPRCAFERAASEASVADPKWGTIASLVAMPVENGDRFEATSANGDHRIMRTATVTEPGRYRISIETQFDGTPDFAIEISRPNQSHALVAGDLRSGQVEKIEGTGTDAGSEPLGPGRFRWWVEQTYLTGEVGYNFAIIGADGMTEYSGHGVCRIILSNPSFAAVVK